LMSFCLYCEKEEAFLLVQKWTEIFLSSRREKFSSLIIEYYLLSKDITNTFVYL